MEKDFILKHLNVTNSAKTTIFKEVEVPGNLVINGVPQKMLSTVLCCPVCGRVLLTLGNGKVDMVNALKWSHNNNEVLSKQFKFCPECGQKLQHPIIIDMPTQSEEETNE